MKRLDQWRKIKCVCGCSFLCISSPETREGGGKINFRFYRSNFREKGWKGDKESVHQNVVLAVLSCLQMIPNSKANIKDAEKEKCFKNEWYCLSVSQNQQRDQLPQEKEIVKWEDFSIANDLQTLFLSVSLLTDSLGNDDGGGVPIVFDSFHPSIFCPFSFPSPWMLFHPRIFESRGWRNFVITSSSQSSSVSSSHFLLDDSLKICSSIWYAPVSNISWWCYHRRKRCKEGSKKEIGSGLNQRWSAVRKIDRKGWQDRQRMYQGRWWRSNRSVLRWNSKKTSIFSERSTRAKKNKTMREEKSLTKGHDTSFFPAFKQLPSFVVITSDSSRPFISCFSPFLPSSNLVDQELWTHEEPDSAMHLTVSFFWLTIRFLF